MTEIYVQFRIAHYRLSGNAPVDSYGIYLFHIPIGVMITIVPADLLPGGSWQVVVAVLALWIFTAVIYQVFERPILINRPIYVGRDLG